MKHVMLLIVCCFMFAGCAGLADYSVELPGNYSIVRSSAHQVTISPQISESHWGSAIIPTKVTEVAWDDNYIVAKQLGLINDPKSSNGYQIPNEDDVHFWIVQISSGKVFGPLDEERFDEKKKELRISERIKLKKVESLKKQ